MFVIMVVAAGCMLVVPFEPASWPLTRDIVTYLWAMFWLVQCMFKGRVELFDAIGFLVYYLVYVLVVVLWERGNIVLKFQILPSKTTVIYSFNLL